MVAWWYGWPGGYSSGSRRNHASPYGTFSYRCRLSFLTTSRWLSSVSWVSAGTSPPIRSASSQSASSRCSDGMVSK